jgi:putative flippase GtrA
VRNAILDERLQRARAHNLENGCLEPDGPGKLVRMDDVLVRLLRFIKTANGKKMLRYAMVSIVSTVLSFGVLGIVFGVLRLWSEVPSTIFAGMVTIAPNYYLNRGWVWGKTGRSHWRREVLPFWALTLSGFALSIVSAAVAHHISVANHLGHYAATAILLAITLTAFGFVWAIKFMIFNRMFRVVPSGPLRTTTDPNSDPQRTV